MTINSTAAPGRSAVAALQRFARPRSVVERCELCGAGLATEHPHLVEPAARRLLCACEACAILFSGSSTTKFRRASRRFQYLPEFRLTDAQWDSLAIPIGLAFFLRTGAEGQVTAVYPSPAGPTESRLDLDAWADVLADNSVLQELEPDTEALLVNRVGRVREHYLVPIDQCYKLVGLIRTYWRGMSGGDVVWAEIDRLFAAFKEQSHA